ncbi:hypothetical protein HOO68_06705 [Candidatus Gracilibacteria bacterium]|nr:hypothetical protein [Candidatus Gracilibacteria bacterium]
MAENTPNSAYETFQINEKTKQFNLLPTFDSFAKSKGLNEQAITGAKLEISRRFADFNKEGMDDRRFRAISRTIGDMVENEMYKAKSELASASRALQGTSAASESVASRLPQNTPGIKDTPTPNTKDISVMGAATGGYEKLIKDRRAKIDAASGG